MYGLRYTCDFTRIESSLTSEYTLEIYKKDYSGDVDEVTGGASAIVHSWETDEPKPAIKGCSLVANLLNESNNISLAALYSTNDDEFKGRLIWHSDTDIVLFEGFLVQEDSRELMVDFTHEISLSFNDNLGLLKEIPFDKARFQEYISFDGESVDIEGVAPHTLIITNSDKILEEGDLISTTGTLAGVYHIQYVSGSTVVVEETVTTETVETVTMIWFKKDFFTLRTLLSFIHSCISSTGLELPTRIFANIHEVNHNPDISFLEQTLIDPQKFFNGTDWDNCYNVLQNICRGDEKDAMLTIFQAKGRWNIVRWAEARYYDFYNLPGFEYDANFENPTEVFLDEDGKFIIGIDEDCQAETGLEEGITRPFKFVKETFNYNLPSEILRNANLQQLGDLITSYADGPNTVYEYEFPWWTIIAGSYTGTPLYFIRIVEDNLGNELSRSAVLSNGSIEPYPIQAAEGDKFNYSFTVVTTHSQPGNVNIVFQIKIDDGSTVRYLDDDGTWNPTVGWTTNVPSGDNTNQAHTFEISGTVPYDGLLTVSLMDFDQSVGSTDGETLYTDIRLEYTPMINQSTKIIGHTHTAEQGTITKNIDDKEIFIDDSPRNSIAGTLFLDSLTGVLQDRTTLWSRDLESESRKLGDIITFEHLFLRSIARTLLEGTFHGLQSTSHVSMLSLVRYTYFPDHNFLFGRLEIDYRANSFSGTLYEMYKDTEADIDLVYNYIFKYLYATK